MRTETSQPNHHFRAYVAALQMTQYRDDPVEGRKTMSGPISISPAQPSGTDATALIAQLDTELAERYPRLDRDTFILTPEQVRAGHGIFLIAKAGGEPVGCGALRRLDSGTGEIKRMYVMPSARGARVGRRLLAKLEWYARQLGMYRLVLHTGLRQPEAIRLYKSMGFSRIAGFGKYNESGAGICMVKTIILPTRLGGSSRRPV
jgi:putative acetyltransferase